MFKPFLIVTLIVVATPALAFGDYWQTEAGSAFSGGASVSGFETTPGAYTFTGVTITNSGTPVPTVSSQSVIDCCGNAGATGQWGYNFTVVGPDNAVVPLLAHIVAHGVASATTNAAAISVVQTDIFPDSNGSGQIIVTGKSSASWPGAADAPAFNIDQVVAFNETANLNGYIEGSASVSTSAWAYYIGSDLVYGHASASVYLDPYLSIDPTWSAANPGYSIVVDQGYGNSLASAVPEPASWALLCIGFGLVGSTVGRRRRFVAA